jgi:DNA-binding Lrp family transcriptional regulator
MTKSKSWRDVLPIHPAAELFPRMSPDELRTLGEDIKQHGLRIAVTVWKEQKQFPLKLLDGRNRLDAIEAVGFTIRVEDTGTDFDPAIRLWMRRSSNDMWWPIEVEEMRGDQGIDPYAFVISANIHRRHLTGYQRDELIAKLLKADPTKSNRRIAKMAKASHPHVAKVREQLEKKGDVETVTTSVDTKGRQQPAKKPQTKAERNRKALERRMAERAAKRKREAERADIKEAETKIEAEHLAAGLIRTDRGLARALHEFLVQCGADALDLMDALGHLLGSKGNDPDAEAREVPAEAVEQPKRKRGRPPGSKNRPKSSPADDGLDIPASLRRAAP